jgi:transposase
MRMQLSPPAEELLGQSELVIITERVDDVALLIGQMITMGLPEVLDRHLPRHWKQRGLSWGWTAVIWLAHILTEGDHRQVAVEVYIKGMHHTLSRLTAQVIQPRDCSDDRLSHLLTHLSKPTYWHQIACDLNERSIEGHALPQAVIRCDATTVSGAHAVTAEGLRQFGHSKDDPTRPQIKVMMGSLDPLGMPLATDVLSGERADDGLYLARMERIRPSVKTTGLLFVGDGKMSALETRAAIAGHHDWYLSPLPLTGATAEAMDAWSSEGVARSARHELVRLFRTNDRGHEVLAAEGYEFARTCYAKGRHEGWTERVMGVRSPLHANHQAAGLDKRLCHAETALAALTPPRGRGKRQITDEATLLEAIDLVLTAHRVEGLLSVAWEKQVERQTRYLGRGRGSASRQQRISEQTRYQITHIAREDDQIAGLRQRDGWKALVTNARPTRLS